MDLVPKPCKACVSVCSAGRYLASAFIRRAILVNHFDEVTHYRFITPGRDPTRCSTRLIVNELYGGRVDLERDSSPPTGDRLFSSRSTCGAAVGFDHNPMQCAPSGLAALLVRCWIVSPSLCLYINTWSSLAS